jgi:hypothetical protein
LAVTLGVLFLGCCGGRGATDGSFGDPVPPPKLLEVKVVGNTCYAAEGEFQKLVQSGMDLNRKSAYYAAYRNTRQNYILVSTYIDFDGRYANVFAIVNPQSVFPVSEDDIKRGERYNRIWCTTMS